LHYFPEQQSPEKTSKLQIKYFLAETVLLSLLTDASNYNSFSSYTVLGAVLSFINEN
jgi:hypothetical protein